MKYYGNIILPKYRPLQNLILLLNSLDSGFSFVTVINILPTSGRM